jgi:hypothetical protein
MKTTPQLGSRLRRSFAYQRIVKVTSGNLRPEGAGGLSLGFQPRDLTNPTRRALKGRQIERPNKVEIGSNGAIVTGSNYPTLTFAPL